ncbi:MAG: c-type cytochrome [Candidatus Scalindua sp.]
MRKLIYLLLIMFAGLLLSSCGKQDASSPAAAARTRGSMQHPIPKVTGPVKRDYNSFSTVVQGGKLFQKNCAACHGQQAQGHPKWRKPMVAGKPTAPPLNGTGHSWHHPKEGLKLTILHGTVAMGGAMPAWKDKLTDTEIDQILAWIQSRWPDDIYLAWRKTDDLAKASKPKSANKK